MAQLAIDILWLLIGIIILAGVVWLAIWVIEQFVHPIPEIVKRGIWVVILLLVIIAIVGIVLGGGSRIRGPSFWGKGAAISVPIAWAWAEATRYL